MMQLSMQFLKLRDKENNYYKQLISNLACLFIMLPNILTIVNYFVYDLFKINIPIGTILIYSCLLALLLRVSIYLLKHISLFEAAIIITISFLMLLSYGIHPEHAAITNEITKSIILKGLPFLFLGKYLYDNKYLNKQLYILSFVILISGIIKVFIQNDIFNNTYEYSQYDAYVLLPASLIFFKRFYNKFNIFDVLFFLLDTFMILAMGARAPIVTVAVFIIVYVVLNIKRHPKSNALFFLVMFILIMIYIFNKEEILTFIKDIFIKLNLSTRIIDKLIEGSLFKDPIRKHQYDFLLSTISKNPFGISIGYDRFLLATEMRETWSIEQILGWYSHNLFIDYLLHFGIVGGTITSVLMVFAIIKTYIKSQGHDNRDTLVILGALSLVPLMVSSFYLEDKFFMLFIAFIGYGVEQHKKEKLIDKEKLIKGKNDFVANINKVKIKMNKLQNQRKK